MKKIQNITKALFIILLIGVLSNACDTGETDDQNDLNKHKNVSFLEQDTSMGDIFLPKGTKVTQIADNKINVELPDDFYFLLYDSNLGKESYSKIGSYTCTCSKAGTCTVFWAGEAGYGCLQSNCKGDCTGSATSGTANDSKEKKQILGVINRKYEDMIAENFTKSGHLTPDGYDVFFEKVLNKKLNTFLDFAYAKSDYKNSEELIAAKGNASVTKIKLQYLGVNFLVAVPNFDDEIDNQVIKFTKAPVITCTGTASCNCILKKKCLLVYCVYYCGDCNPCSMVVSEN